MDRGINHDRSFAFRSSFVVLCRSFLLCLCPSLCARHQSNLRISMPNMIVLRPRNWYWCCPGTGAVNDNNCHSFSHVLRQRCNRLGSMASHRLLLTHLLPVTMPKQVSILNTWEVHGFTSNFDVNICWVHGLTSNVAVNLGWCSLAGAGLTKEETY